jgi:hypothetical protein
LAITAVQSKQLSVSLVNSVSFIPPEHMTGLVKASISGNTRRTAPWSGQNESASKLAEALPFCGQPSNWVVALIFLT